MRIRCWGSRGSIPVSGAEFVRYGGDTSCVEVESTKGDVVLLDAGTGIRAFGNQFTAVSEKVIHLVFTHMHLDHVIGFPFFGPIYNDAATIHIYGSPYGTESLETTLRRLMRAPLYPVDLSALSAQIVFHETAADPFMIGALTLTPIRLNHPGGGCGFRVEERDKSFVFLTDNELEYGKPGFDAEYYEEFCAKADLLFHDAAYTDDEYPRYESWGHSKYTDAIRLAAKTGSKRLGFFHISARRTDDEMDAIVNHAKKIIADSGTMMECYGVGAGFEIEI